MAALLFATAGAQGVMIYAATHDPTFAVEPDYYRKAVAWDSAMALERRSLALGWRAVATLNHDGAGGAHVQVLLTDSLAAPVRGARVRLIAIHNLDAARPRAVALRESGDSYDGLIPSARAGVWELRLDATVAGARFTPTMRAELPR